MAASKSPIGTYFAGVLDYDGGMPDLEGVAAGVDLLKASDVKFSIERARLGDDGHVRFPFVMKELEPAVPGMGQVRSAVEAVREVFDGCNVTVRELKPRASEPERVRACAKLAAMGVDNRRTRPDDLACRAPVPAGDDGSAVFDGLVGLEAQRRLVYEIGNAVAKRGRGALESCHMVFSGPPGTGKTELARRLLAFFDARGVTSGEGVFVKADASDLIGRYVGHTPHLVRAVCERACGGVLFIDEAYRLVDGGSNQYGIEAVNALTEILEADRDRIVCIMAGYADKMDALLSVNAGLRDRFGFRVPFRDYSDAELAQIFFLFARAKGFVLAPDVRPALAEATALLRRGEGFSNARTMRRLFDRALIKQALRCDSPVLQARDIREAMADDDLNAGAARVKVGFC